MGKLRRQKTKQPLTQTEDIQQHKLTDGEMGK
jgi:hypothetical protein